MNSTTLKNDHFSNGHIFLVAVFLIVSPFHDSHGIDTKNRKDFANEIIQRVNFLENDNVIMKTKLGNIEQETEVNSDEIQKLSNVLEEIQDQGKMLVSNTSLCKGSYINDVRF